MKRWKNEEDVSQVKTGITKECRLYPEGWQGLLEEFEPWGHMVS